MSRELIDAAQAVIDRWDSPKWRDEAPTAEFIGRLRKAVDEEKARTEWVKFTDALPIVPEGDSVVYIFIGTPGDTCIYYAIWYGDDDSVDNYTTTHWTYQPRPYTPQPPRSEA